jgi:MinD superfamily P-loop ATPase
MKEIVVISGKGGTGKTSVTASFAALASKRAASVFADCDVDAADLHLVLSPDVKKEHAFISGVEAVIRKEDCAGCGRCAGLCRFDAIANIPGIGWRVDVRACEGCGVCAHACPVGAIDMKDRMCGKYFESETRFGALVHAELAPHAENSGKLVSAVRKRARAIAEERGADYLIVDGPPGIGCPVIASITGANAVVIVTEPTLSGEHDLLRVAELARHFRIPAFVCVNKREINPEAAQWIERLCTESGITVAGSIPYDTSFTAAQLRGLSVVEYAQNQAAESLQIIWENICRKIS